MSDRHYATIPSDDAQFRRTVERLAEQVDDVDRLRQLIATIYPNAHVSIQDPLGSLAGPLRVYIYRDGKVTADET